MTTAMAAILKIFNPFYSRIESHIYVGSSFSMIPGIQLVLYELTKCNMATMLVILKILSQITTVGAVIHN